MGMFGLAEIINNLGQPAEKRSLVTSRIVGLFPTWADLKASSSAVLRATGLGSVLGVLPGGGPTLAAFSAYVLEKKMGRRRCSPPPERPRRGCRPVRSARRSRLGFILGQ